MHATPDRYLDQPYTSNGASLLDAPPRVSTASHSKHEHPAEEPPSPVTLGKVIFALVILIAAGLLGGWLPRAHQKSVTLEESRLLAIPTVRVSAPAPSRSAEPISLSGELRPVIDAPIYARVSGYVRKWCTDIGTHVEE